MRPRQRQLGEEDVLQQRVEVLARVHEALVEAPASLELGIDGSDLHVVRPRADHVDDQRHLPSVSSALDEHFGP
jgi:hypothetical protein